MIVMATLHRGVYTSVKSSPHSSVDGRGLSRGVAQRLDETEGTDIWSASPWTRSQDHVVWQSGHVDFCEPVNHLYRQAEWNLLWHVLHSRRGRWPVEAWMIM